MAYRVLRWFLHLVTKVFFRQIEVVGLEHVPATGPVIFAGNHPNSLIDPMLIITTCGRQVNFAAKDTLFKNRFMRQVLRGLGAVPVARKDDHGGGKVDNDAAFTAMFEVLGAGGTIGIFPEGLSHDNSQLAKLKTGAARLAIGGAAHSAQPIRVVPCGLTFINPKRFRSRVLVQYAEPLVVEPIALVTEDAPAATNQQAKDLTIAIDAAIRRLTINAPDWDTVRALDVVRRLYQPKDISIEDRVELSRRFNTYYPQFADHPRVISTLAKVRAYQQELDELGISDRELAQDLTKLDIGARIIRHLSLVSFWLPMTAPGAPRKDVIATTKIVIGLLLALISYVVVVSILWWKVGWTWALLSASVLVLSGWATLRVLDRVRLVKRALGTLFRRLRFRREVVRLRAQRAELVAEVIAVVNEVRPASLTLLFPADDPRRMGEPVKEAHEAHAAHAVAASPTDNLTKP
jgi:glycerol-3-phosphate O-acyltransferase / dihydroxyacetone phosphate acyltransferase